MMKGRTIFAGAALAAVVVASGVAYAAVTSLHSADATSNAASNAAVDLSDFTANPAGSVFLEADLSGRGEMLKSGQNMGDPNGSAMVVLRITRNRIMYEITWQSMMPGNVTAIAGVINSGGNKLLNQLLGNPSRFNANFTTPRFPGGAVRGQFRQIGPFDFNRILHVGQLVSVDSGDQVVTSAGDPNAHATVFVGANATTLNYAAIWTGVTSPTALNVNNGAIGAVGNLVARLFAAPRGLNPTIIAVAGMVPNVSAKMIAAMKANPAAFHTSLVTGKFPGGAARGQLFVPGANMPTTMPTTTMTKPTTPTMKPPTSMTMPPTTPMNPPTMPAPTGTQAPPHW